MTEAGSFLTTPIGSGDPASSAGPERSLEVVAIAMGASAAIVPEWRTLVAESLDDAPFASPEFLIPAAAQGSASEAPHLVTVWETISGARRMVGLFPLAPGSRPLGEAWSKKKRAAFWSHPLRPLRTPALAGPETTARQAVGAFLDWLRSRPGLLDFDAGALPAASVAARLIAEESSARGMSVLRRRDPRRTYGLDFRLQDRPPALERVSVTTEPAPLRHALERLFCLEGAPGAAQPILIGDPREPAMLRAVLRSFAPHGKAAIAMTDNAEAGAGALTLIGRDRAYLWRMMGSAAGDPTVQAALVLALELRLGMPVTAAAATPLAGVGTDPGETESFEIGLASERPKMIHRMRSWISSGILGF